MLLLALRIADHPFELRTGSIVDLCVRERVGMRFRRQGGTPSGRNREERRDCQSDSEKSHQPALHARGVSRGGSR
jgi:hypothetical protein